MARDAGRLTAGAAACEALVAALTAQGVAERAERERAYLKSDRRHLGVPVPAVRATVRARLDSCAPDHATLIATCDALLAEPVHERWLAAVELLAARTAMLTPSDLPWIEDVLRRCATWALVDGLAGTVVAEVVRRDRDGVATLDRWVHDDDMWIRRSAVLGLRGALRDGTEIARFVAYADDLLGEREFFIRKVLGWVAREIGRRHPDVVAAWLRDELPRMNAVTLREAVKPLPDGPAIVAEWQAGRAARQADRR